MRPKKDLRLVKAWDIFQAAEILGVHHNTVTNRIKRGELKSFLLGGKRWILRSELDAYLIKIIEG